MTWADKAIAHPQGYERAVLFPRARDALRSYIDVTRYELKLPICVCPEIADLADDFLDVDACGMAQGTQLYGYRYEHTEDLDLDPLMTGWWRGHSNLHRIVSFGANKILPLVGGGAFLTNDSKLAEEMSQFGFFPGGDDYSYKVEAALANLAETVYQRRRLTQMWDRYLGDMLVRIPREQVMPWNVMRLAPPFTRAALVLALRKGAIAVSINYPMVNRGAPHPYPGAMRWEDRVISLPLLDGQDEKYIDRAATIVYRVVHP